MNNIILIIDDNDLNTDMVQELLQQAGFTTLQAQDADGGIRLAETHHPAAILMDMYMPHKDGYEATRLLKANPETADIPVIAFTALAMPEEQQRAKDAGCVSVISKPIDVEHFVDSVKSALLSPLPQHLGGAISEEKIPMEQRSDKEATLTAFYELDQWMMGFSHDAQGPIRKIQRFSDFLKKSEPVTPANLALVEGIDRSTAQLQELLTRSLAEYHSLVQAMKDKIDAKPTA